MLRQVEHTVLVGSRQSPDDPMLSGRLHVEPEVSAEALEKEV